MNEIRDKARVFFRAVRQWVGDSPGKATAFGVACFVFGYAANGVIGYLAT